MFYNQLLAPLLGTYDWFERIDPTYMLYHIFNILIWVSILIISFKLIKWFVFPLNYRKDMTIQEYCKDLGEIENSSKARKQVVEKTSDQTNGFLNDRSISEDTKYANGWIPVIESWKVKPGSVVKSVIYSKDIIITRSHDGKQVDILDAYCPHAGVHIGVGGFVTRVDNESCVQCPFHGWAFRASDGQCVDIPYQKKKCIPSQAKLSHWPSIEIDNFIYLWYHADNIRPTWTMTPSQELISGKWVLNGRSCHISNMELEYMHENGADLNHFAGIHEDLVFFGGIENLAPFKHIQRYIKHSWEPEWKQVLDEQGNTTHMAQLKLRSYLTIFGFEIFNFSAIATQIGPARVKLIYNSFTFGRGMLTMNSIPVGGRRLKYIQHVYSGSSLLDKLVARIVLMGEVKMLERDLTIWNHKKFLRNPVVVPEDKTIKQFRLWYSQFYRKKIKIVSDQDINYNANNHEDMNRGSLDF